MLWIMRRVKRRHNALWVQLVWMEPFGYSTWCVWVHPHKGEQHELARSSSKWAALVAALSAPVLPLGGASALSPDETKRDAASSAKRGPSAAAGLTERVMASMREDKPSAEPLTQTCVWCEKRWVAGHLPWCSDCMP
jgi:hypothetical protein